MLHHGPWIAKLDYLGSQTVTFEVRQRASHSQEIRRLRREGSKMRRRNNHLAEGSVNIVKGLIRTLKCSSESNLRTEIGPSHLPVPWIIEHAAQLKNRYMMGADGRTPTERLRGRGVRRPVCELGEKVLFARFPTRRLWRKVRPWDLPQLQIIRWPGVHWNTFRSDQMQDSATAQCSGEMGHRIRAEHQRNPWSPDFERAGDVNIRVDLLRLEVTEVCIRQILTHQSSPGECASLRRCSRRLVSQPNACVAVPFEQELGTRQTTLSDVAKGLNRTMMRTWAILRVTGGDPESRLWKKEKRRGPGLMMKKVLAPRGRVLGRCQRRMVGSSLGSEGA